jgi:hypothetical protein
MTRHYIPEKTEMTVVMVLNDAFLGVTDGPNDGFGPSCILSSVHNTNTRFFTVMNFISRAAISHAAFLDKGKGVP